MTNDDISISHSFQKSQIESDRYLHSIEELQTISHRLSGWEMFLAIKQATDELVSLAPKDHDILVQAFDISVREIRYIEPHTLLFSGLDQKRNHTSVVAHFSQVVAHVIYLPKQNRERIITGFSPVPDIRE